MEDVKSINEEEFLKDVAIYRFIHPKSQIRLTLMTTHDNEDMDYVLNKIEQLKYIRKY